MSSLDGGTVYKCPHCGWQGARQEMVSDARYMGADHDEQSCDTVCPECEAWNMLHDYEIVGAQAGKEKGE